MAASGQPKPPEDLCSTISVDNWQVLVKVPCDILEKAVNVSIFSNSAVIHTSDRRTYITGTASCYGLDEDTKIIELQSIKGMELADAVYGSGGFLLLLTDDGRVYSIGENGFGQLGVGHKDSTPGTLHHISSLSDVEAIAAGYHHCLAKTRQGEIYGWGSNGSGQASPMSHMTELLQPTKLGIHARSIACSCNYSAVLTNDGQVLTFGYSYSGVLGAPGERGPLLAQFPDNTTIVQIEVSKSTNYAISDSGEIWAWGQLIKGWTNGKVDTYIVNKPNLMVGIGAQVASVRSNGDVTIACTTAGRCYHWGRYGDSAFGEPREVLLGRHISCDILSMAKKYISTNGMVDTEFGRKQRKDASPELQEMNNIVEKEATTSEQKSSVQGVKKEATTTEPKSSVQDRHEVKLEKETGNIDLQISIRELTQEIKDMKSTMEELTVENNQVKSTLQEMTKEDKIMKSTMQELTKENKEMKSAVQEVTKENKEMKSAVQELTKENKEMKSAVQEISQAFMEMKARMEESNDPSVVTEKTQNPSGGRIKKPPPNPDKM